MRAHTQHNQDTIYVEDAALRAGFTQMPNLVLRRPDVTPGAKLTYMALLSYAWQQGSCFPGQRTLARDMGVSKRSVITYLQQLEDAALLRIRRRGLGQTNVYTITRLSESNRATPRSRSEESALQQVKYSTRLEVQNLHGEEEADHQDTVQEEPASISNTTHDSAVRKTPSGRPAPTAQQTATRPRMQPDDRTGRRYARLAPIAQILAQRQSLGATAPRRPGGARMGRSWAKGTQIAPGARTPPESHPGGASGDFRGPSTVRRDRLPRAEYLSMTIRDFSRQLHDAEHERANISRAIRLWQATELDQPGFVSALYQARSVTQKQAGVKKRSAGGGLVNRMPYFFAVVENLLGLRRRDRTASPGEAG